MRLVVVVLVVAAALSGCASASGRFEFALIGDQQYNTESEAQFLHLMADIDRADVDFVVHVGDFKAGTSQRCDDTLFQSRKRQFDASRHPFIYTPGDNEWTDCHHPNAGGFDPIERLARLREIFFSTSESLGRRKLALEQQRELPENVRWRRGGVLFVTVHMVGSNNLGRTSENDAEYRSRMAANVVWLHAAFDLAKRSQAAAVAIFAQANPRFEWRYPRGRTLALGIAPAPNEPSGFAEFLPLLEKEVVAYGKPVLFLHGDSHYFRVDKPLFRTGEVSSGDRGRQIENFTRVEGFGFPEAHWLRVAVDARDPSVFTFREQIVPANLYRRR